MTGFDLLKSNLRQRIIQSYHKLKVYEQKFTFAFHIQAFHIQAFHTLDTPQINFGYISCSEFLCVIDLSHSDKDHLVLNKRNWTGHNF